MICKFNKGSKAGGTGPINYLLGKDRDRPEAIVLAGDPELTQKIMDESPHTHKYTCGYLSFAEPDLEPDVKAKIMRAFEKTVCPGLEKDQYNILWVQHTDKGRLELNFVIPQIELTTGKHFAPYFHQADEPRIDTFVRLTNANFDLADPRDPDRKRDLSPAKNTPIEVDEIKTFITDMIHADESINSREKVVELIQHSGFEIATRKSGKPSIGKEFISIKSPQGKRNIRLKGALFSTDFDRSKIDPQYKKSASDAFHASRVERRKKLGTKLTEMVERKAEINRKKYKKKTTITAVQIDELVGDVKSGKSKTQSRRIKRQAVRSNINKIRNEVNHNGKIKRGYVARFNRIIATAIRRTGRSIRAIAKRLTQRKNWIRAIRINQIRLRSFNQKAVPTTPQYRRREDLAQINKQNIERV